MLVIDPRETIAQDLTYIVRLRPYDNPGIGTSRRRNYDSDSLWATNIKGEKDRVNDQNQNKE